MRNFREKLARFMYGRYGADEFYRALFVGSLVFYIAGMIVQGFSAVAGYILYSIGLLLMVYAVFRFFSKNIPNRQKERRVYLKIINAIKEHFRLQNHRFRDRKTHVFRRCPHCRAVLRLPKRKGVHTAVCPRCTHRFDVKIGLFSKKEK